MEGMPSESRISVIRNSPSGKAFLEQQSAEIVQRITEDTRELITSYANEAVSTVAGLMRGAENEGIRLRAAQDLLDRGGFKPVERQAVMHVEVDGEDITRLVSALNEARQPEPELEFVEASHEIFKRANEILIDD